VRDSGSVGCRQLRSAQPTAKTEYRLVFQSRKPNQKETAEAVTLFTTLIFSVARKNAESK
jgi:hypothetical protein